MAPRAISSGDQLHRLYWTDLLCACSLNLQYHACYKASSSNGGSRCISLVGCAQEATVLGTAAASWIGLAPLPIEQNTGQHTRWRPGRRRPLRRQQKAENGSGCINESRYSIPPTRRKTDSSSRLGCPDPINYKT